MRIGIFGGKRSSLFVAAFLVSGLALLVSFGCDRETTGPETSSSVLRAAIDVRPDIEPMLEMAYSDVCKNEIEDPVTTAVMWRYDSDGGLLVRRWNAAFSCDANYACEVNMVDRVITVMERDDGDNSCLCIRDIGYWIKGLRPGKYTLRIDERVSIGDDMPLEAEILLKGCGSEGQFSAERTLFPWCTEPSGQLNACFVSPDLCSGDYSACVSWEYSGSTLDMWHCNYFTYCCPLDASLDFEFAGNMITITENVQFTTPLWMIINLTIDWSVFDLAPGEYVIRVNRFGGLGPVEFTVDLVNQPSGEVGFD